jgi:hypothetical protein
MKSYWAISFKKVMLIGAILGGGWISSAHCLTCAGGDIYVEITPHHWGCFDPAARVPLRQRVGLQCNPTPGLYILPQYNALSSTDYSKGNGAGCVDNATKPDAP